MIVIQDSPEYHYLNYMNDLKSNPSYWTVIEVSFRDFIDFDDLVADTEQVEEKLKKVKTVSDEYLKKLQNELIHYREATLYQFSDYDLLALIHVKDNSQGIAVQSIYERLNRGREGVKFNYGVLAYEYYRYQNLIDKKFLSSKKIQSLREMSDMAKVDTIPLRRSRRDTPVILIVEDDSFTASYTTSLLNKDFDVVCAKNGEDAIIKYIDHAPDSVFLDIILPGISGQQTLKAIKAIDPSAFVVMLSVDTVAENIKQASRSGAFGFLKKPFSKDRIIKTARQSPFIKSHASKQAV